MKIVSNSDFERFHAPELAAKIRLRVFVTITDICKPLGTKRYQKGTHVVILTTDVYISQAWMCITIY
jgi:hypothetical protein